MKRPTRKRSAKKKPVPPGVDLDPYFDWALGAGKPNFFLPGRQSVWIPVLLKLSGISVADFAQGVGLFDPASPQMPRELELFKQSVKVPDAYTESPDAEEKVNSYCMAMVAHEYFMHQIRNNKIFASKVTEVELGLPLDADSLGDDFLIK